MTRRILIAFSLTLFFGISAFAGEISPDLAKQIAGKRGDSLVTVWIKLPRVEQPAQLKAAVNSAAHTRAGRYKEARRRITDDNKTSQKNLLSRLNALARSGKCSDIKASWLANLIEVKIAVNELNAIASRGDVEMIYALPKLTKIEPEKQAISQSESSQAGVEPNLTFIKAPQAWAAGYTGAGRIICLFDDGIEGTHPAIYDNWKGHDGDSAAAWFDPRDQQTFPHLLYGDNHGTHVTGILLGHDDATGDTVGVALDAKWISAGVVDVAGASYIDAFEWAADPDGDPNSVDDVPDVINHSWGFTSMGCEDIFYELIENLEALGIVNIFAAGNSGPGAQTITNPANRALDSLDCFAVGNCTTDNPPTLVSSSSRGPSPCNGAIKPNVVAPGLSIRSCSLGGGYTTLSGTSMASPHVAGLVALLRQKNPNATVDEIKTAILTTTQPFGMSLPNNNFGWGVVDCMAALNAISSTNSTPNLRVYAFDHNTITPNSNITGSLVLQNLGSSISPITATILGSYPNVVISDGSCTFGAIGANDTLRANDSMSFSINAFMTEGTIVSMDMRLTNGTTYDDTVKLHLLVEPKSERSFVTHDNGNIQFSVSNFGTYGFGDGSFFPVTGGAGFNYKNGGNDLFECGLMIGYDSTHVSDGVRNSAGEPDGDFRVEPGGNIEIDLPGAGTAQKTRSIFNDSRATNPIGLKVQQLTYSFGETDFDDFVILRYIITNTNAYSVNGLYVGIYTDWDVLPSWSSNAGGYDAGNELSWTAYNNGVTLSSPRGTKVLDGTISGSMTATGSVAYYNDGFREKEKDSSMGIGFSSAATYQAARTDLLQVTSVGPIDLSGGASTTVAFALLGADDLTGLDIAAFNAQVMYDSLINNCCVNLTGDLNGDSVDGNILDLNFMVNRIFRLGPPPACLPEGDVNGDGNVTNILDLNHLVNLLFRLGPKPVPCAGY